MAADKTPGKSEIWDWRGREYRFHLSVGPLWILLAAETCEVFILADQWVTPSSHGGVRLTSVMHHPTAQICSSPESLGVGRLGWSNWSRMQASAGLLEVTESRETSARCCQHGASPAPALTAAAEQGEHEASAERWGKSLMELGLRGCGG